LNELFASTGVIDFPSAMALSVPINPGSLFRADAPNASAQPAIRWISIEAWVPEQ
jgi:hypothetical protein